MGLSPWIILSVTWTLANVQAVLTFLINVLCALGIWAMSYVGWKAGALEVIRSSQVDMLSLLSMTGLGDAIDALLILRPSMGLSRIFRMLLRVTPIIVLTVTAILSGPISNYSTQQGSVLRQSSETGWTATKNFNGMGTSPIIWNATIERLKSAQFPQNQLLDFLPDNRIDWNYKDSEWNSSWLCSCSMTPVTPINLTTTGNYTTGSLFDEVPAMRSAFPQEFFVSPHYVEKVYWTGTYEEPNWYKDVLAFPYLQTNPILAFDNATGVQTNYKPLRLAFAAFHMHHVPSTTEDDGNFGIGIVGSANYTLAVCNISREPSRTPDLLSAQAESHIAFPWTKKFATVGNAVTNFHDAAFQEQSFLNETIFHPTGEDLFRFYQAYMICKDTQYKQTVQRDLSVTMPTVELATVTLAIIIIYVIAITLAVLWFGIIKSLPRGVWIPQSKAEWMMQALREAGGREVDVDLFGHSWDRLQEELRRAVYGLASSPFGTQYMLVQLELRDDQIPLVETIHHRPVSY